MTVITKKPESAVHHLTPEDIEAIGRELDAIRQSVIDSRGEDHAKIFDVRCTVSEPQSFSAEASGSSRRQAEQDAAEIVLGHLIEQSRAT